MLSSVSICHCCAIFICGQLGILSADLLPSLVHSHAIIFNLSKFIRLSTIFNKKNVFISFLWIFYRLLYANLDKWLLHVMQDKYVSTSDEIFTNVRFWKLILFTNIFL